MKLGKYCSFVFVDLLIAILIALVLSACIPYRSPQAKCVYDVDAYTSYGDQTGFTFFLQINVYYN